MGIGHWALGIGHWALDRVRSNNDYKIILILKTHATVSVGYIQSFSKKPTLIIVPRIRRIGISL